MRNFKLFVSSPGDVMVERRRVENVVSRLNGEFDEVAHLETVRWETKFYQAFSSFQKQIPLSTECDIVVGILKWRLGTELPPEFEQKLPDGRPYPSGTAYEILSAIKRRQEGSELPDIYVFRFEGASPSIEVEDPDRGMVERQWSALKGFFRQWFITEGGQFRAAFNTYRSEDDFEEKLERLLRELISEKVAVAHKRRWSIKINGSPFRGLEAFGTKHASVFFGRGHDTARAVELWREAATRGCPYLMVLGTSGAGKSSLARAGLLPRLMTPGVIKEVDVWRAAGMRPSDSPSGPFASLAAALMQDKSNLPKEEEGRTAALPEIAQGDSRTTAELEAVLRHPDSSAVRPLINALSRIATEEHDREGYNREVRCDLVLLIDQFEELFAASVSEEERDNFIDLLAALARTGRFWIAITLRADFYSRMIAQSVLKELKEQGASFDLLPPGPVELAEIVRGPAEAAGLVYETDAATGESLDMRILREADRPDMLPLVELALSRLFEARETKDETTAFLSLAIYQGLGGLKGIINEVGERALASLADKERTEAEKTQLPRLLRRLAAPTSERERSEAATLTIRAIPLAQATPDEQAQKLVDALLSARLLTASGSDARGQIRLVHQRVLEDWNRAREIVSESGDFYRIRADVEEQRRRYEEGGRRVELLLQGRPLAEAEDIVDKYGDELTAQSRDYVRASRARANRSKIIAWSVAACFALLAIGLAGLSKFAFNQMLAAQGREKLIRSQTSLIQGKIAQAVQEGLQAHDLLLSEATRSNLIAALGRISQYFTGALDSATDLPGSIAWVDDSTAAVTMNSGYLRYFTVAGPAGTPSRPRWMTQTMADIRRNNAVPVALRRLSSGDLIIVYSDSSIGVLRNQTNKALIYQPENPTRIYPLAHAAAVSESGSIISMASFSNGIESFRCDWHTDSATPCRSYHLPLPRSGDFRTVAISPDERFVAIGDQAGNLYLCDSASCRTAAAPFGAAIAALGWSRDGNMLAAGTMSGEVIVVNPSSRVELARASTEKPVTTLTWSPSGTELASVCAGNGICLWDLPNNSKGNGLRITARLVGHLGNIIRLQWSANGNALASVSDDRQIFAWSVKQNTDVMYELPDCGATKFNMVSVSPDLSRIAAGGADGRICLWSQDKLLATFARTDNSAVEALAWSKAGVLATLHEDGALETWSNGRPQSVVISPLPVQLFSRVIWNDDGSQLAVTVSDGRIAFVHSRDTSKEPKLVKYMSNSNGASGLALRSSDDTLFASYSNGALGIINFSTQSLLGTIAAPPSFSGSLSLSPDGRLLAATGSDSFVTLYDIARRSIWKKLPVAIAETRVVAFSPDGRRLAALGSSDDVVYVWDLSSSEPVLHESLDFSSSAVLNPGRRDAQHVNWIGWLSSDDLVAVSSAGKLIAISLDERKWRSRIRNLGLDSPN